MSVLFFRLISDFFFVLKPSNHFPAPPVDLVYMNRRYITTNSCVRGLRVVFFFLSENYGHTAIYEEPYDEHDYTNPPKRSSRTCILQKHSHRNRNGGSIYYQCEFLASCLFRLQCTVSIYKSSNPHCQRRSIDR